MAELVGQPTPKQSDGVSFLPTLRGDDQSQQKHDYLYWEFCTGANQKLHSQAVRFGDWKAFRQAGKKLELFNLADDPFEKQNLAGSKPDLVKTMEAMMAEAHEPLPDQ